MPNDFGPAPECYKMGALHGIAVPRRREAQLVSNVPRCPSSLGMIDAWQRGGWHCQEHEQEQDEGWGGQHCYLREEFRISRNLHTRIGRLGIQTPMYVQLVKMPVPVHKPVRLSAPSGRPPVSLYIMSHAAKLCSAVSDKAENRWPRLREAFWKKPI